MTSPVPTATETMTFASRYLTHLRAHAHHTQQLHQPGPDLHCVWCLDVWPCLVWLCADEALKTVGPSPQTFWSRNA